MAQDFYIITLKQDEKHTHRYEAEIRFRGRVERYEIYCNIGTKIRFKSPLMITVDDCIPAKDDDLHIRVKGVSSEGKTRERELEEALIEYAFKQ